MLLRLETKRCRSDIGIDFFVKCAVMDKVNKSDADTCIIYLVNDRSPFSLTWLFIHFSMLFIFSINRDLYSLKYNGVGSIKPMLNTLWTCVKSCFGLLSQHEKSKFSVRSSITRQQCMSIQHLCAFDIRSTSLVSTSFSLATFFSYFLPSVTACNATHGIAVAILSICLSVHPSVWRLYCWQN